MLINFDAADRGTPEWWLRYLLAKLDGPQRPDWANWRYPMSSEYRTRRTRLDMLWAYYTGNPPLPQVAEGYQDSFREKMRTARCNYAPMCVNAMLDRMELQAVSTTQDSSTNGDDVAAEIADVSNLSAELKNLFGYAFSMSESYGLVVPPAVAGGTPLIKSVDPRYAVGEPDPVNPIALRAFLHLTYDPVEGVQAANLYLPGQRYRALASGGTGWEWADETVENIEGIDELGGVPAVRFENLNGLGEFEPHLDLLDRINDTTLKRMVLTEYQAFRQRAVIGDLEGAGDDLDEDSEVEEIDWNSVLAADPGALWRLPAGTTFWESNQADLTPIITAKDRDVKEFAAVTATPLHLITPDAANGSAEGASLMREALNHKVMDRRARFTPALKLLYRIAFAFTGDPKRGDGMRLLWGSIESNSLADRGSASAQARGVLSLEAILTDIWGKSPEEAADIINQLSAEQMMGLGGTTAAA